MENNQWVLEKIEIKRELWGKDKGKYKGDIKFSNGQDTFTFALNPTLAKLYLSLIKDTVIQGANELGNKLIASLEESTSTSYQKDAIADWADDYNKPNQITK